MNKTAMTQPVKAASFLPPSHSLLQRKCACGNHTMGGSECADCAQKKIGLQRKLTIGASNDPLEQEADRIADQVMASSGHGAVGNAPVRVQRFTGSPSGQMAEAPASVERVLASPGRPLEPALRQDMEGRFGYDFSRVRVHTGGLAEQSAREVNANAYTVGNSVVFGRGQFAPNSSAGKRLITHELTHVVQQSDIDVTQLNIRKDKRSLTSISLAADRSLGNMLKNGHKDDAELPLNQHGTTGNDASLLRITPATQLLIQRNGSELADIHDPGLSSHIREMFGDLMNRVMRIESGETTGVQHGYGSSTSTGALHGYDVIAVVRIQARDGAVLVQVTETYSSSGHAEVNAISASIRRLTEIGVEAGGLIGGRITVLVTKTPCSGCATEIAELAERLGVAAEQVEIIYVTRESLRTPGTLVQGRTALRTRLTSRVTVRGLQIFSVVLFPLQWISGTVRTERDIEERGYAAVGMEAFTHDPWWLRLGRILTGEAIFAHSLSGIEDIESRFDIERWREVIRERAAGAPEGGTIPFTFQAPNCDWLSFSPIENLHVIYTLRGGIWHANHERWIGRANRAPDLNRIIDPMVPDSEIRHMLSSSGACLRDLRDMA